MSKGQFVDGIPRNDGNYKHSYDWRANIGHECFASTLVSVREFGGDTEQYYGYDFEPYSYQGVQPGDFFELYNTGGFLRGVRTDNGPILEAGKCGRIPS